MEGHEFEPYGSFNDEAQKRFSPNFKFPFEQMGLIHRTFEQYTYSLIRS